MAVAIEPTTEVRMSIEQVNPVMASDLLENVGKNRHVTEDRVKLYARQMKEGEWQLTGEPIIIDQEGRLADGQHRLWAVIESGETVEMAVVRGVEPDNFNYMNTGKTRSLADILTINGYTHVHQLASMSNLILSYEMNGKFSSQRRERRPAPYQVLRWLEDNETVLDYLKKGGNLAVKLSSPRYSAALVGALWFILAAVDSEDAESFFGQLAQGLFTEAGDPIYSLRERLLNNGKNRSEYTRNELAALTFKAWNAWRKGEQVKNLLWRGGGTNPEAFPVPE